jgi:phosphatidylcholine synthase
VTLAILTFVPSKYLYPSLPGRFNRFMSILGIPWMIALVWIIFNLPESSGSTLDPTTLKVAWASLSYPLLYLGASWVISVAHWMKHELATTSE